MIYQNLQDVAYLILRRKCLVVNVYIGNEQRLNKNNISIHLKKLEREKQMKPEKNRMKWIIKMRAEINNNKKIELQ